MRSGRTGIPGIGLGLTDILIEGEIEYEGEPDPEADPDPDSEADPDPLAEPLSDRDKGAD